MSMFWGQEALSSDSDFATCHVCETLGKLILLLLGFIVFICKTR